MSTLSATRDRNKIESFVNQLHDDELQNRFFQQDGAPTHCSKIIIDIGN